MLNLSAVLGHSALTDPDRTAVVPLNVLLRPDGVAYHLADSQAVALFCHDGVGGPNFGPVGRAGFERTPGCGQYFALTADPDYARELEEVLMTHPAVSLAAVVGVPHDTHGEEVKAFVVRSRGAALTEDELIAWCRARVAACTCPRLVEFRDEFPMTATGKVLKRALA